MPKIVQAGVAWPLSACGCAVLVVALVAFSSKAALITYNADNQPITITGLVVSGYGTFDVTINYDDYFPDIRGSQQPLASPMPYFLNDSSGALTAAKAPC